MVRFNFDRAGQILIEWIYLYDFKGKIKVGSVFAKAFVPVQESGKPLGSLRASGVKTQR